ncbi:hypothetical protein UVI_02039950 [Ustilaginoidea virens]|uniref:Uncharacterized protein n=1 Tax=Ustilaginoidea virens TaxID=1159556 RepID=A0A1B5KYE5_USTVR|nr:hypothetical protein UVI_02039950 [Ustilaginoidea virens]
MCLRISSLSHLEEAEADAAEKGRGIRIEARHILRLPDQQSRVMHGSWLMAHGSWLMAHGTQCWWCDVGYLEEACHIRVGVADKVDRTLPAHTSGEQHGSQELDADGRRRRAPDKPLVLQNPKDLHPSPIHILRGAHCRMPCPRESSGRQI